MARREFPIAPVLTDVLHYTRATLDVEYPVAVSDRLKGSLDYLLQSERTFLVIEARNEDLELYSMPSTTPREKMMLLPPEAR